MVVLASASVDCSVLTHYFFLVFWFWCKSFSNSYKYKCNFCSHFCFFSEADMRKRDDRPTENCPNSFTCSSTGCVPPSATHKSTDVQRFSLLICVKCISASDCWLTSNQYTLSLRRWPISAFQQLTYPHRTCKYQNVQRSNTAQNNERLKQQERVPHPFEAALCGRLRFIFFKLTCKWYAFTSWWFNCELILWQGHSEAAGFNY